MDALQTALLLLIVLGRWEQHQVVGASSECARVFFGPEWEANIACECNRTHCDSLPIFEWPSSEASYLRFVSDRAGRRLARDQLEADAAAEEQPVDFLLELQSDRRAQQVSGFGGAFTDSASEVIWSLEPRLRASLLEDYFGPTGLEYNMGRVPISGTDMSSRAYSYDDLPAGEEDLELKRFELQREDLEFKIPLLRAANAVRAREGAPELKLIAASWSAPAWMKSNLRLVQGRLRGNSSSAPYYDAYARYIVRFLAEYRKRGLGMWALTPQNEPHTPHRVADKINFNSVNFGPREMADYLANSLVPELLAANQTRDKLKLFIWDDTLDDIAEYQQAALEAPVVRAYMAGTAIHWYSQGLRSKPYALLFEVRQKVIPAEFSMISTEACFIGQPKPGNWDRGLRYARDVIENLRAGSLAWIDWNLALNTSGGPTWANNILDAAVLVEQETGARYFKNPMFYALAHLTRFVKPNSYVIPSHFYIRTNASAGWQQPEALNEVTAVAAELADALPTNGTAAKQVRHRKTALVLLNRGRASKRVRLILGAACRAKLNTKPLTLELAAESITSLAFLC